MAGTDRDCLHAIDLFFGSGAASLPEVLITDTGSYSDLVFGIAQLLGVDYRPALADLPDQKGVAGLAGLVIELRAVNAGLRERVAALAD